MVLVDSDVAYDIIGSYMMWIYSLHVERNIWYEFYLHVIFLSDLVKISKLIEKTNIIFDHIIEE